ncbi:MAG: YqaE/Pmp3 family membrane protein [Cyclobacteriaceae bacterium]
MSVLQIILAIFLPPVAVVMSRGLSGAFWLNVLFTIIGWLPGVIHAFYILSKNKTHSTRV